METFQQQPGYQKKNIIIPMLVVFIVILAGAILLQMKYAQSPPQKTPEAESKNQPQPVNPGQPTGQQHVALPQQPEPQVQPQPAAAPAPAPAPKPVQKTVQKKATFSYIGSELTIYTKHEDDGFHISWTQRSSPYFGSYKVMRSETNDNLFYPNGTVIFSSSNKYATSTIDRKGVAGKNYYYRVCEIETSGEVWCGNVVHAAY